MIKLLAAIMVLFAIHVRCLCQVIPGDRTPVPGEENELLLELKNSKPGVDRTEILLKLNAYYLYLPGEEKADLRKAMLYNQEAKRASIAAAFQDAYNEAMILSAEILLKSGDEKNATIYLDSSLVSVQATLKSLQSLKQPAREIRALRQLATIYREKANNLLAEETLLKIVQLYQANGFRNLHYTYNRLATVCLFTGDYNKALSYSLEAVKSVENTGDTTGSGFIYQILGMIYRNIGQFQKSVDCYKKAIELYKTKSGPAVFELTGLVVNSLLKMKRHDEVIELLKKTMREYPDQNNFQKKVIDRAFGSYYKGLKQYDLAELHYLKMFTVQVKDSTVGADEYKLMGQLYVESGKYAIAKPYLDKAIRSTPVEYPPNWFAHLHFLLFKTDSAAGNYLSAIDHLMKNKALNDVVYEQTKASENQEMQIKYETEKKDRNLVIQQSKLQQAKKDRNIFVTGAIMLLLLLALLYNRYQVKQKNNQEINKKNLALQHLVNEKEWLLKEVHHRVKNNLQTVVSLLESQSAYLQDDALLAIQDSQNRVYAMSLIHQKLYQAENVASIDMEAYLRELVNYLRESFNIKSIYFDLQIAPVELDVSQAIPVGLIVNEAITNSIKYAFNVTSSGRQIMIGLNQRQDGQVSLVISDNGKGIHKNFKVTTPAGLGLKLMKGLAEDLAGKFSFDSANGTTISVIFKVNAPLHKMHRTNSLIFTGMPA